MNWTKRFLLNKIAVSLLVRLWVEILILRTMCWTDSSASLWGCELKCIRVKEFWQNRKSQPPCEAVSWNIYSVAIVFILAVSLLVRLWVEMFLNSSLVFHNVVSLLVRLWVEINEVKQNEKLVDVSLLVRLWVEIDFGFEESYNALSASLWGCELK